jgi:hypothetical protein
MLRSVRVIAAREGRLALGSAGEFGLAGPRGTI